MKHFQRALSFIYGFSLMYFVSVWLSGFMSARAVPRAYFEYFRGLGHHGLEVSHALLGTGLHLIPKALLLLAGVLAMLYTSQLRNRRSNATAFVLGAAVSYFFWLAYFEPGFNLSAALASLLVAPWWAWPAIIAPVLGLSLAYGVALNISRIRPGA
jgi:hypothetical protein